MIAIAVTGIGIRCAGSDNADHFWENVTAGRGAVGGVVGMDIADCVCQVGGQMSSVPTTGAGDPDDRMLHLLVGVTSEALERSGTRLADVDPSRIGLSLGQCQGPFGDADSGPFMHYHLDALAAHLNVTGPRTVVSTACMAGSAAVAHAAERIAAGEVDVMLAGGMDELSSFTWRGFTSLQSLSPDGCAAYSRSDGLVLGEGAAILVLEPLERVLADGRTPLAELLGWGFSADGHHITAPDPSAHGAVLAMRRAMSRARLDFDDVDYVCGHGTGTKANDEMEIKGLRLAFEERAPQVPLSSIKPMIGHTLGAAGAIEAAVSVFALRDGILPPTINFDPGTHSDLDFVPNEARQAVIDVAMSNNYAFGGNNSSLVFARPGTRRRRPAPPPVARGVCVSGIGLLGPVGSGYEEWRDAFLTGRTGVLPFEHLDPGDSGFTVGGELPELSPRGVMDPSEWRQLDPLSRLALTVARQAWQDAKLRLSPADRANVAVIFGSGTGPTSAIRRFTDSVGDGHPSPLLFPNTVYTAAPGHICRALALHGPTTTFTSGGVAGMHAIEYGAALVAAGEVDYALVVAAEELHEWSFRASGEQRDYLARDRGVPYQRGSKGANLGAAGVALVFEPVEQAADRDARTYGRILSTSIGGDASASIFPDPRGARWASVIEQALERAGATPQDVGYVASSANGALELDSLETGVLASVVGNDVPVSAPKSITGETLGASGPVALVAALTALEAGAAPPTAGLTDPVGGDRVRHVMGEPMPLKNGIAIANAFSLGGNYGSMVVAR